MDSRAIGFCNRLVNWIIFLLQTLGAVASLPTKKAWIFLRPHNWKKRKSKDSSMEGTKFALPAAWLVLVPTLAQDGAWFRSEPLHLVHLALLLPHCTYDGIACVCRAASEQITKPASS